jgi:hypothetical protein
MKKGEISMIMSQWLRNGVTAIVLLTVLAILPTHAFGDGYDDEDFSLRFPAALSRFSSYADVAAVGGACAGSKWQSSVNPASTDWQSLPGRYHVSMNPQYSAIVFEEDTVLQVASESITQDLESYGSFIVAFAQVRSNEENTRQGIEFSNDMNYAMIQWGKKFTDDLALGANLNYSSADVENNVGGAKLADTSSDSYGIRLGALYHMAGKLLGGLVLDYGWSPSETMIYDIFGMGIGDVCIHDTTRQFLLRAGPSYEYRKDSAVYVDYQYGYFNNDMGTMRVHRMLAGVDHRIVDFLFIRGGLALDDDGNESYTGGLGIYPTKELGIDIGYQYDMFPEIDPEFGRSQAVTLSLSYAL